MLSEPTDPRRMPYLLPFTQSSHTWIIRTATPGYCLLTSTQFHHDTDWKTKHSSTTICNWILEFLTSRPHGVQTGSHTSSMLMLKSGAPQGCVFSPLLSTPYTYDCTSRHQENATVMYAEDNINIGRISNSDVTELITWVNEKKWKEWHTGHDVLLNVSITKELTIDFRKKKEKTQPCLHQWGWSRWTVIGSWESTWLWILVIIHLHLG